MVFISKIVLSLSCKLNDCSINVKFMAKKKTRDEIKNSCYNLLLINGYENVSITDIQKECSISRGLLYHYFSNKEALFYEVITELVLPQFFITNNDVESYNIYQLIECICEVYDKICVKNISDGISLINYDYLIYRAMQSDTAIRDAYDKLKYREKHLFEKAFDLAIEQNMIRGDISSTNLAHYTISLIDGVWLDLLSQDIGNNLMTRLREMLKINMALLKK